MRPGSAVAHLARHNPVHAVVFTTVVAAFVGIGAATGNGRVWPYLTVVLICTAIVGTVDRAVGFSAGALWLLALTGVLHLGGGLIPAGRGILYGTWIVDDLLRFDQLVHAIGSAAATVAAWQLLGTWLGPQTPVRTQAWLAALAGLGKGAINEVVEFIAASRAPTYVGGFENTGWDLVFDVLGVAAAAIFLVASCAPTRPLRAHQRPVADVVIRG